MTRITSLAPRTAALLAAAAVCMLPVAAPAAAQEAAAPPGTSGPAAGPQPIPAEQIPARASSAGVTLDSIRSRLSAATPPTDDRVASMGLTVDRLRQQPDFSRLDRLPEFRIAELQRQVRFYRTELADLESRDVARATRLSADAAELSRLRSRWSATLEAVRQDDLSKPLVDEARSVLDQIEATKRLLERPLADTLAARARAARFEVGLETLSRTLEDAGARARSRRLTRDLQPIWAPGALTVSPERDWISVQTRIEEQLRFSGDYFAARSSVLQAFGLLSGLGLAFVAWLRKRSDWLKSTGNEAPSASRVLKRPFASLILVLLVIALLSSELAPPVVIESLAVLIMVVLLRLMPERLVAGHYFLLVGLALMFLTDRARAMMPFDSLAFRADQLLVAAGLVAGYAYVLWQKAGGGVPERSWLALLARIAPVALLLLLAAAISNLLGNISLADLLVRGTLTSTYASAILFAAAFITGDFISMMVRSRRGQQLRMVTLQGETVTRVSQKLIRLAALIWWGVVTLMVFQLWDPLAERAATVLQTSWSVGELKFSLGGIMTFVIGVLMAVYVSRFVRFLLNEEVLSRLPWPVGAKSTTATLVYYGVLFGGLLLALNAAGIQTSQFAIIVGALGVGIGFGLQTVVNNFVSGLILMFERPIQPGDIIDVDTLQGRVVNIGLRATRVRTWDGAEVVVPNGTLLSGNLINWTLSDSNRRIELQVGVAYGTEIRRVMEVLKRVADARPDAMRDPAPMVLFHGFGDSSLDFLVRFWTRDASTAHIARSDAAVAVAEALAAEGIEIPFPQRDLHIRSMDAGAAKALK